MYICAKLANGHPIMLDVETSDTIDKVKSKITTYLEGGLLPVQQRLIFAEHHDMVGQRTLSDYDIQPGATLHMVKRSPLGRTRWTQRGASSDGEDEEDVEGEEESWAETAGSGRARRLREAGGEEKEVGEDDDIASSQGPRRKCSKLGN